ncbi:hypothetical protein STPH2_1448 [Streptomyces sp. KO7888]|nr:hypothetical protein [Streptomyces sp. KO7888]
MYVGERGETDPLPSLYTSRERQKRRSGPAHAKDGQSAARHGITRTLERWRGIRRIRVRLCWYVVCGLRMVYRGDGQFDATRRLCHRRLVRIPAVRGVLIGRLGLQVRGVLLLRRCRAAGGGSQRCVDACRCGERRAVGTDQDVHERSEHQENHRSDQ